MQLNNSTEPQPIRVNQYDDGQNQYLRIIHHAPYPLGQRSIDLNIPEAQVLIGELLKTVREMIEERDHQETFIKTSKYGIFGVLEDRTQKIESFARRLEELENQ